MKKGYDIMFPSDDDTKRLMEDYEATVKKYTSCGYEMPRVALRLIHDMYEKRYYKELEMQHKAGKEEVSQLCQDRIEALSLVTQMKLLNTAMSVFKNGNEEDCVRLTFIKGKPDEETKEFFNLMDRDKGPVNIIRTQSLSLPATFEKLEARDAMYFQVFRDGEIVSGMNNGVETIFQGLPSFYLGQNETVLEAPSQE